MKNIMPMVVGASSYVNKVRKTNSKDLISYLKGNIKSFSEYISDVDYLNISC